MVKEKKCCTECGRPMMKNKHTFNRGLASTLLALANSYGLFEPFNPNDQQWLTHNQKANFQKLQYWGLVVKHYTDRHRVGGYWHMTREAFWVLNGKAVPRWVETYKSQITETAPMEEWIFFNQALGTPYSLPEAWAARQTPVGGPRQGMLL